MPDSRNSWSLKTLAYLRRRRTAAIGLPVISVFAFDRNGTYKTDSFSGTHIG
jgi:hypothetical protein